MKTNMPSMICKTKRALATLQFLPAVLMTAIMTTGCGGGSEEGPTDSPTSALAAKPALKSDAQAIALAARTVNAAFAYDGAISEVVWNSLGSYGNLFGIYCNKGTSQFTLKDANGDGSISVGDSGTFRAKKCKFSADSMWTYTGKAELKISKGKNIYPHWTSLEAGSSRVDVKPAFSIGADHAVKGQYSIQTSSPEQGQLVQGISIKKLNVETGVASLTLRNVYFSVDANSVVKKFSGTVSTQIEQLGSVEATLSLNTKMKVDSSGYRFLPLSGSVRVETNDYLMNVSFAAEDKVVLQVDNRKNGTIDRTVETTRAELDRVLNARNSSGK